MKHEADEQAVKDAGGPVSFWPPNRHESRRMTTSCAASSGRQGRPGTVPPFFLSLEDDLMRIFGSERLEKALSTLGMNDGRGDRAPLGEQIALERAQAKVDGAQFRHPASTC